MGTIGSGKTTLARRLSYRLRWKYLGTDDLRQQLNIRVYEPNETEQLYIILRKQIKKFIARGESLILDATFYRRRWRETLLNDCSLHSVPVFGILCDADVSIRKENIRKRQLDGHFGVSDVSILKRVDREFEKMQFREASQYSGFMKISPTVPDTMVANPSITSVQIIIIDFFFIFFSPP